MPAFPPAPLRRLPATIADRNPAGSEEARVLIHDYGIGKRAVRLGGWRMAGGEAAICACENAFHVLQTGFSPAAPDGRVLKVDAVSGVRSLFASYPGAENYALLLRPILVTPPVP